MENLILKVEKLQTSWIKEVIGKKIQEFELIGNDKEKVFSELCFCLLTANFVADKSIKIQQCLGKDFCFLPEKELAKKLKEQGHRFPNKRAEFICLSRDFKEKIFEKIRRDKKRENSREIREFLAENIKGLGMKESSHFLRNIGYKDVAIIDFHILDLLNKENILGFKKKSISKKEYLEIEKILEESANKLNLSLAELDLYLWFMETGKVLK
jgi:N-glycosylase/DNA lyase